MAAAGIRLSVIIAVLFDVSDDHAVLSAKNRGDGVVLADEGLVDQRIADHLVVADSFCDEGDHVSATRLHGERRVRFHEARLPVF